MPSNDSDPFLEAIKDQFRQTIQEEDVEEDITQDDIADATSEVINSVGEDIPFAHSRTPERIHTVGFMLPSIL